MYDLTNTDKRLISALKLDGRASVTNLAAELKVSRATVQARLNLLIERNIIQRFTVEVDAMVDSDTMRAVMLIQLEGTRANAVTSVLNRIPEVVSLHTTNGNWDLIAHLETYSLPEFDRILRQVREVKGVLNSETSILLNTAST